MNDTTLSGERLRRAFLVHLASSVGASLTSFGLSLALARLLSPAELGLFAIALGLAGLAQVLRDAGVSAYLQHAPVLDGPRWRACVVLSLASTAAATALLLATRGLLARHFGQAGLAPVLAILALGLAISPYGSLRTALALRALDAVHIARVSRLGSLAHAIASIGLSLLGTGAQGLAWAYVINIVACAAVHALRRVPLPTQAGGWPRWPALREPLRFGLGATAGTLLQTLHGALPDLLLGQLGSPRLVGLLGRAQSMAALTSSVLGAALGFGALPGLAQRHHRREALAPLLSRALALLTGLGWPLLAVTVCFGQALVRLLYGPAWLDAVPALLPLALVAGLALLFGPIDIGLAAVGRPELVATATGLGIAARLLLVPLAFDGHLSSCAWALAGASLLAAPLRLHFAARHLGLGGTTVWRAVHGSAGLAAASTTGALLAPPMLAPFLAVLAPIALLSFAGVHPLREECTQLLRLRSTIRK